MNFTLVELTRIKLEPGEVLSVKLYGDDYEPESVAELQKNLQTIFPNNKIAMFVLPTGHDLQMEAVSGILEDKTNTEKQQLVDKLNAMNCGPSFCEDCSCGKKAAAEALNDKFEQES